LKAVERTTRSGGKNSPVYKDTETAELEERKRTGSIKRGLTVVSSPQKRMLTSGINVNTNRSGGTKPPKTNTPPQNMPTKGSQNGRETTFPDPRKHRVFAECRRFA